MAQSRLLNVKSGILLVACSLLGSCHKKSAEDAEAEKSPVSIPEKQHDADARQELGKTNPYYKKVMNADYESSVDKLPVQGRAEPAPYSGYWYPNIQGGTNVDITGDHMSPVQKYDLAFNKGEAKAAGWETKNHGFVAGYTQHWHGHCNGFAAASQRHLEPRKEVVRQGVKFKPADIKALLAELYMNADYVLLAGNRCDPGMNQDRPDPTKLTPCTDSNAGTFHVMLANWIGRGKQTLIFDANRGTEVWNYPVYEYFSEMAEVDRGRAVQLLGSRNGNYPFNPQAVRFRQVKTVVTYANVGEGEVVGVPIPGQFVYQYILELDNGGNIIGGEWMPSSEEYSQPDFVWLALEPITQVDQPNFGNPFLDKRSVLELWAESVGKSIDSIGPGLSRIDVPAANWGEFTNFHVVLDGDHSGVAFLGKEIMVDVARDGNQLDNLFIRVLLNGAAVKTDTASGHDPFRVVMKPEVGVNKLSVVWFKQDGTDAQNKPVYRSVQEENTFFVGIR